MMKFTPIRVIGSTFLVLCVAICFSGCLSLRGDAETTDGQNEVERVDLTEKRVFLGNVSLVNENSKFVLIKTPVNQRLKTGIPLESFRDGELTSELLFSPEQSYGFMTADIRTGAPVVGDSVFLAYSEGFGSQMSDKMKYEMEKHERLQKMSFWERRKYERKEKRKLKEKQKSQG
ncbi:MAG: hypothetical protein ACI8XO_004602 [Verrucomicrobiales bacterium]|jgi:hypothetical protein